MAILRRSYRRSPSIRETRRVVASVAVLSALCLLVSSGGVLARSLRHPVVNRTATGAPAALPPSPEAPIAVNARLMQTAITAHLVFDLSAPVDPSAFVLADPARVVVDLPEVSFRTEAPRVASAGRGLVTAFRFGLLAPGRSRIVIDLGAPARIVSASSQRIANDRPSRLVIDLAATDAASFRQAAATASQAEAVRTEARRQLMPATTDAAPVRPVVVLDPGHGGVDAGASGVDNIVEKDIVFAFARILAGKLEASGRYQVVLTRSSDVFVPLDDRVEIARRAHAALFVSIHADSLSDGQVTGATVYTVSDRASDAEAARIAETENKADIAGGLAASSAAGTDVADILFDLTRRETRTYAHVFSRGLVDYLKDATRLNKNPVRSAGFVVLKAPDIPSVLVELGYLSNHGDASDLNAPAWRDKAATSMAAAVDRFFASRQALPKSLAGPSAAVATPPQPGKIARAAAPGDEAAANAPH